MITEAHLFKILGVTTDNVFNNDTMIDQLSRCLVDFPDASNQTRCFLHILSITAKAIIGQFDIPKARKGVVMDEAARALASLAEGLDTDEQEAYECGDDEVDDTPLDWWVDLHDGLTDKGKEEIELNIQPVQITLTKVSPGVLSGRVEIDFRLKLCKFVYAVKNLTTLPQWYKMLSSCGLPGCIMPCDVSTHWNLTYDMLLFVHDFCPAIDVITTQCDFDLQKYELSPAEWGIAKELRDILKVFLSLSSMLIVY